MSAFQPRGKAHRALSLLAHGPQSRDDLAFAIRRSERPRDCRAARYVLAAMIGAGLIERGGLLRRLCFITLSGVIALRDLDAGRTVYAFTPQGPATGPTTPAGVLHG